MAKQFGMGVSTEISVGVTSTLVASVNPSRIYMEFFNGGTGNVYIHHGPGDATLTNSTVIVPPTGTYFVDVPIRSEIRAIADAGTNACVFMEA